MYSPPQIQLGSSSHEAASYSLVQPLKPLHFLCSLLRFEVLYAKERKVNRKGLKKDRAIFDSS